MLSLSLNKTDADSKIIEGASPLNSETGISHNGLETFFFHLFHAL